MLGMHGVLENYGGDNGVGVRVRGVGGGRGGGVEGGSGGVGEGLSLFFLKILILD